MIDTRTPTDRLRECLEVDNYAAFSARWSKFGFAIWHAAELHRARRAQVAKTYRAQAVSLTAPMIEREDA